MKNFQTLHTDFYQLSMAVAYIMDNKANVNTGFEGFIRHIKTAVNPNEDFYIFDGETEIKAFIKLMRVEIKDPEFKETFWKLIEPKITAPNKDQIRKDFDIKWEDIETDFEFTVVPNGTVVLPKVPVFQYKGPKIWGQIIETIVTNIYNGRTGLATIKYLRDNGMDCFIGDEEFDFINGIMNNEMDAINQYEKILRKTAKKFRKSTDKLLLEASYRRSPSKETADMATTIAIQNGWNGTSNVGAFLQGFISQDTIGGTMAHAFVMSYENERDAFIAWDRIFPATTMLIDTYDVVNAATMIKQMVDDGEITSPTDVRIDSDPLDVYSKQVDEIFNGTMVSRVDNVTGQRVDNFISGDMSVEKFEKFEFDGIPFTKAMAGTKYVYDNMIVEKLNSGFVYKIVEYVNDSGEIIRPLKRAVSKSNYPGLKQCSYNEIKNELTVWCVTQDGQFGFNGMDKVRPDTKVEFKSA